MNNRIIAIIILLFVISKSNAQTATNIEPNPDGSYTISGTTYSLKPGMYAIGKTQYNLLEKAAVKPADKPTPKTDVPAPIDEPQPKQPKDIPTPKVSKEQILKLIAESNVGSLAKSDITNKDSDTSKPDFDLLKVMRSAPTVKSDTEPTPLKPANPPKTDAPTELPKESIKEPTPSKNYELKKDFLLLPTGITEQTDDSGIVTPSTDIGVSVGSKIDFTTPWEQAKPVPYGKMIQFWVKPVSKRPEKLKSVAYNWTILPKDDVVLWPDTTRIIISSGNKQQNYVVMLTASYVFIDGEKIIQKIGQAITMVNVGEATVQPQLPPTSLTGIAKLAYEWTSLVTKNNRYDDDTMKADARKLAKVFKTISAKIDNAELTSINDILDATKIENDKALGDKKTEWWSWFSQMSELLKNGFKENTIRTPQHYSEVWKEIAKGLESIK